MALANGGCDSNSVGWAPWLLNPQWTEWPSNPNPPSNPNVPPSHCDTHQDSLAHITEQDIPNIMDQYRNLMFDFTFPETVDFRDLVSGQLAATYRSTVVTEHTWRLRELVEGLKGITAPHSSTNLDKNIAKIEASLNEVRLWVEDQRTQQLMLEGEGDQLNSR